MLTYGKSRSTKDKNFFSHNYLIHFSNQTDMNKIITKNITKNQPPTKTYLDGSSFSSGPHYQASIITIIFLPIFFIIFLKVTFKSLYCMCTCMSVHVRACVHTWRSERTCRSWCSTTTWVTGIKLRTAGFNCLCLYPLIHLIPTHSFCLIF